MNALLSLTTLGRMGITHPARYYSPGLLHSTLLSSGRRLGDLGGLESGVVVVPSGAGLVAAPPS
jgi:hypothetical protein